MQHCINCLITIQAESLLTRNIKPIIQLIGLARMHKSKYDRFLCVINEEFKQHLRYHSLRGYVFSFLHNDGRRTIIVYFRNRQLRRKGFEKFSISRDLFNKVEISPRIECTVAHVKHFLACRIDQFFMP